MQKIPRFKRYVEATGVFGAVTLGRTRRTAASLSAEADEFRARLPLLGGRVVSSGINASGVLLRGVGHLLHRTASSLDRRSER